MPGVGVLRVPTRASRTTTLLAAAESVGAQLALFGAMRDFEARRRAMLDVAFDSVVTMDDRGVVLSANRAAERTFGYTAAEMVGREVAELIIPPALREAHRDGLARYLKTGRGPVVGRRVELTAMRADGTEFPVELVVTRPEAPGRARLLRLPARPDRALRGRDRAAPAGRRAGGAAARGDGGGGRARSARLFALVSEEVGRLLEAQTAHMFRFDSDGQAGRSSAAGRCGPSTCCRSARGCRCDGDTAATRVWRTGRPARMDTYDAAEGELAATLRGYGVQAVVAAPVFLGGALWGAVIVSTHGPAAVPRGRRAADLLLRRAGGAGAGQRAGARGAGRLARPHRRRPATPSAGGWSATCTTARSSGWCRWR